MDRAPADSRPDLSAVEILLAVPGGEERNLEPVTCGIPWPRGVLPKGRGPILQDEGGNAVPLQARTLDRWADGSVRWLLLDWQARVKGRTCFRARPSTAGEDRTPAPKSLGVSDREGG